MYKYLMLHQSKLGLKLAPVKEAIQMSVQPTDIERAALTALSDVLLADGWLVAECSQFCRQIKPTELICSKRMCISLKISLEMSLPSQLLITCHARMGRKNVLRFVLSLA